MSGDQPSGCCSGCHMVLHEPFVQCCQCRSVNVCTSCFSKGKEFSGHLSNHDFAVVKSDFSLLEASWNASKEQLLLTNLLKFGQGNWDSVAKAVTQKTASECQEHFERFYLDNESGEFVVPKRRESPRRRDQPLAHLVGQQNNIVRPARSLQARKDLAGYNAARSDFETEYDNAFEVNLNRIEVDELMYEEAAGSLPLRSDEEEVDRLSAALSKSMLSVYSGKLKARHRRKRIVREYGLLNKAKATCLPPRYSQFAKYSPLRKLGTRLMCSFDFDFVAEGLNQEAALRRRILHLQECREMAGLRRFAGTDMFCHLKLARDRQLSELSTMNETVKDWSAAAAAGSRITFYEDRDAATERLIPLMFGSMRRAPAPMNIVGLPAYNKLRAEERELCSVQRVLPEVFIEIKAIMMEECAKGNGLRLSDVRPMLKIDVNKTKKIYEFFLKQELIREPAGSG